MDLHVDCLKCRQRMAWSRGNCLPCYRRHLARVKARKTTWARLEADGLAAPKRRGLLRNVARR